MRGDKYGEPANAGCGDSIAAVGNDGEYRC